MVTVKNSNSVEMDGRVHGAAGLNAEGIAQLNERPIWTAPTAQAPTLFLGDGINDAPAIQAATVSVAFGVQSDITAEAADAVILETSLSRVDELIHIARHMRHIAL
jgi:hypothetical protein